MQLYTVYLYLEIALHVSSGTSTHHRERVQLYLQHLVFVPPLLLPAAIAAGSSCILLDIYIGIYFNILCPENSILLNVLRYTCHGSGIYVLLSDFILSQQCYFHSLRAVQC